MIKREITTEWKKLTSQDFNKCFELKKSRQDRIMVINMQYFETDMFDATLNSSN